MERCFDYGSEAFVIEAVALIMGARLYDWRGALIMGVRLYDWSAAL